METFYAFSGMERNRSQGREGSGRLHRTMIWRRLLSAVGLGLGFVTASACAQVMQFRGTIGQQKVAVTLDVKDDAILSAKYRYESQKAEVPLTDGRFIGSTVVLADEDGNVFHLHLKKADGGGSPTLSGAVTMVGTMNRDDLELPVAVERVAEK